MKQFFTLLFAFMPIMGMAQNGYHADVFVEGGIMLNSEYDYPVFKKMGLTVEKFLASKTPTEVDTLLQESLLCENPWDENGILFYPDGAPRYRFIYMNRGKAAKHGQSLDNGGRSAIERFVNAGGGYVGTCAAAFLISRFLMSNGTLVPKTGEYLGIWPGATESTQLGESYTAMVLPADSPLSKTEQLIDSIPHSGGCFALENLSWPPETEVLARFETTDRDLDKDINGKPAVWSYRPSKTSGRVVVAGSQVEQCDTPEALWLMEGMIRYAIDANPEPAIKANLTLKDSRQMIYRTSAGRPREARIGDGQFHYFTVDIPKGRDSVAIVLSPVAGWEDFDLFLYASKDRISTTGLKNDSKGVDKELVIKNPEPGKYYIAVYCATTVDTIETSRGTQYTGRIDVLNGVPYILSFK